MVAVSWRIRDRVANAGNKMPMITSALRGKCHSKKGFIVSKPAHCAQHFLELIKHGETSFQGPNCAHSRGKHGDLYYNSNQRIRQLNFQNHQGEYFSGKTFQSPHWQIWCYLLQHFLKYCTKIPVSSKLGWKITSTKFKSKTVPSSGPYNCM